MQIKVCTCYEKQMKDLPYSLLVHCRIPGKENRFPYIIFVLQTNASHELWKMNVQQLLLQLVWIVHECRFTSSSRSNAKLTSVVHQICVPQSEICAG